jgi:type IV secretion system protein VirB9
MFRNLMICFSLLVLSHGLVFAADTPDSSVYDSRIKSTLYNPKNVVELNTAAGYATHILFEEGEEYQNHAFGDGEAWQLKSAKNHIFIKPKAEHADTNLVIITNKRTYTMNPPKILPLK